MPQTQTATQQEEEAKTSEKTEEISDSSKTKVLIIEDDEMICDMYRVRFSEDDSIKVLCADKGEEGLELAQKEKPNVILLDIILPGLDGFAVLEKLKADPAIKDIPVVLLTNLGQEEDIKKGNDLGAADYLVKAQVTPKQVLDKVKGVLEGKGKK